MIYGIIDIGSNTIRLSIYRCEENEKVTRLINKKTMAGLASYVKNGEITKSGIKKACEVLNEYKEIIENLKIEKSFVFATASLRNFTNTDAAVLAIKEKTGFDLLENLEEDDDEEIDTLGGLVFVLIQRVPQRGEVIEGKNGMRFRILDVDSRHIKKVMIVKQDEKSGSESAKKN